jgi:cell division protein FtsB
MKNLDEKHPAESELETLHARQVDRRLVRHLLGFAACALAMNALVGERGLVERWRAQRHAERLAAELTELRRENVALRRRIQELTEDPYAIESLARAKLGLLRRGELLVLLKDRPSD